MAHDLVGKVREALHYAGVRCPDGRTALEMSDDEAMQALEAWIETTERLTRAMRRVVEDLSDGLRKVGLFLRSNPELRDTLLEVAGERAPRFHTDLTKT